MTARKKTPAKRGRKPSDAPKVTQLTVRLRPSQRLALELLARHRNLSMSQTIEFALARLFKTWHIDNVPVWDHVSNVVVNSGKGKIDADGIERLAEKTMQSEGLLILRLPESLRKQDEDFFVRVAVAVGLDDIADLDKLLALARDGYRDDLSVEDVAERYKEVHRTKR